MNFSRGKLFLVFLIVLVTFRFKTGWKRVQLSTFTESSLEENERTQTIMTPPTAINYSSTAFASHSSLANWFQEHHSGRVIFKWTNYFAVYEKLFQKYVGRNVVVLEIGVQSGGSIDMWREYFGSGLIYHGVDVSPWPKKFFEKKSDNIFIHTGSQEDRTFMRKLALELGQVDILIDDGGHTMRQQITTLEVLYDLVAPNGIFLTEDVHTSYADGWDGSGYRNKENFVEYVKKIIDQLYGFYHHRTDPALSDSLNNVWKTASISFYPGIIAFEKQPISKPESQSKGSQKLKFDSGKIICPSRARKAGHC